VIPAAEPAIAVASPDAVTRVRSGMTPRRRLGYDRSPVATIFPDELEVVIDVPRFGFVKHKDDGSIDFVSPLPCPFNYGSVPDTLSGDGDREDAIVLGPRLAAGSQLVVPVRARVAFIDRGLPDGKWICSHVPLSDLDRSRLRRFFALYARAKQLLYLLRGTQASDTRFEGLEEKAST
jgi:inorganic pyrophosphatase